MSDFTKRLRQIESENSECSILAGNCADAIEIEHKKVAIEIARLRAENEKLRAALAEYIAQAERGHQTMVAEACELRKEIHKLRAALKPFADWYYDYGRGEVRFDWAEAVRAAAAALKETGDA